jgi:LacI family transcriptional regulator
LNQDLPKPPGIKDIARAAGISIGTVDRALRARSGVSPTTRARVLKIAEQLGYRPNIAARNLKLNRRLRIAAYLPREIASFFDPLRAGIRAAGAASLGTGVELYFRTYPKLDDGDLELLETDIACKYDGIILALGNPNRVDSLLRRITRLGTVVVCVASDAPRSGRLASISVDGFTSGAIAAELFARTLLNPGSVATITGELTVLDHAEKLRGFAAGLAMMAPHLALLPVLESQKRPRDAYRQATELLSRKPRPLGLYISTINSTPIMRALEEHNLLGQIKVITTDLFPELVPLLEAGKILASLSQRPYTQGKIAFETITGFLLEGRRPEATTKLAPHIVLRSNLPQFVSRIVATQQTDANAS